MAKYVNKKNLKQKYIYIKPLNNCITLKTTQNNSRFFHPCENTPQLKSKQINARNPVTQRTYFALQNGRKSMTNYSHLILS